MPQAINLRWKYGQVRFNKTFLPSPSDDTSLDKMQFATMLSALGLLLFASLAQAQFQFFEQMFGGGGGQQQAQPQNMPSDSEWYQTQYEAGEYMIASFEGWLQLKATC